MLNHKGFTLIELLIVIMILGILAMVAFTMIDGKQAHGMELGVYMEADDGNIAAVAKAMKHDDTVTVTVLAYSVNWDVSTMDVIVDAQKEVIKKIRSRGIAPHRIITGFANKGGLEFDGMGRIESHTAPPSDGVYLYLD
jgi:prepilin-type N-terminal cleavage/methylation domain-containing protein